MSNVPKISEAASMALHAMAGLAQEPERALTTGAMASRLGVSEAHLSKVLQRLARVGLVRSTRGPKGGFRLARASDQISLREVYETIEGPLQARTCLLEVPACDQQHCILGDLLPTISHLVADYLGNTRLSDVAATYTGDHGEHQEDHPH
jgi:Rrf2 family protein